MPSSKMPAVIAAALDDVVHTNVGSALRDRRIIDARWGTSVRLMVHLRSGVSA